MDLFGLGIDVKLKERKKERKIQVVNNRGKIKLLLLGF
jgi:hypothetical protein